MRTTLLTIFSLGLLSAGAFAQNVGIGNTAFTPHASSILELKSTTGGFLMPRMTQAQRDAISSPANGLMIYQTNNTPGYYYYDGSAWQNFGASIDNLGNHTASQNLIVGTGLGMTDTDQDTKVQVEKASDEDRIRFDVAGSEAMMINNNGNVGVGTSSPTEKLHVEGNIRLASGGYLDDDATAGGNNDDWVRLNGFVEMKSSSDDHGLVIRDKDNNEYVGITQRDGYSYFSDNNTSANYFMRGDGSNVEVKGDVLVMGSDVYDNSGDLRLSGEGNVMITMDYDNNDADDKAIKFGKNNMGSPTELVRITESGRLGVGDVNPIANIQVYGSGTSGYSPQGVGATAGPEIGFARGGFYNGLAASIQMIDYNGYSGGLCFNVHRGTNYGGGGSFADNWPNDVIQAMTIRNNGNIGVGTGDPTNKLDVVGTIEADGLKINTGAATGLVLTSDAQGNATWQPVGGLDLVDDDGDTKVQVEESADEDKIRFDVKGTQAMIIDDSGNLGIGTSSPSAALHLKSNLSSGLHLPLLIENAAATNGGGNGSGIGFNNHNANSVPKAAIFNERSTDYGVGKIHFLLDDDINSQGVSLSDSRMTVTYQGRVGIGTTSPDRALHVISDTPNRNVITVQSAQSNGWSSIDFNDQSGSLSATFGFANSGTSGIFTGKAYMNSYDHDFVLTRNSSENSIFIEGSTGDIGFNTSDPTARLDVNGDARVRDLAGSGTRMVVADANGNLSTQAIPSGGGGGIDASGVNGTGSQSTSSSSYSNVNNMSLSLDAGTYIMTFNAEVDGTNSSSVSQFGINVNGGIYSASEREHEPDNGEPKTITVSCVVTVNYSQTVRVQFRKSSGSGNIKLGNRSFTAIKIS
ncbi:MAG: hypothetical protein H6602_06595 [Flavobacteriales bacterium]|nr:hypothetical protein [Flavobacteriales bacterium]